MEDKELKQLVADTGRILVAKELVARTWGNISARKDATHFAISPSGLGYDKMQGEDVPIFDYENETWEGTRKPSSEKKIHAAGYRIYPEVNFIIHTHQDYATAIGLVDARVLEMTEDEKKLLGNIEIAGYGLPGTKGLKKNVEAAMLKGSKTILMAHHGAVLLGKDQDEAIKMAETLEIVCKRAVDKRVTTSEKAFSKDLSPEMQAALSASAVVFTNEDLLFLADRGGFKAQLDDMAQMLGGKLKAVDNDDAKILKALNKQDAVLVKGVGCVVLTEDPDDAEALKLLITKAAIAKRYTIACNKENNLSGFDCKLMRFVYKKKYSKKKAG